MTDPKPISTVVQRCFLPGGVWLYFKVYMGEKVGDQFLANQILPWLQFAQEKGQIEHWFFIRYADPGSHLRIRLLLKDQDALAPLVREMSLLASPYQADELLEKIEMGTYMRELERYGPSRMEASEALFGNGSLMVCQFLGLVEGAEGERLKWLFAMLAMDRLLNDFGVDLSFKAQLLGMLRAGFAQEHKMDKKLKGQLDQRYRKERPEIESFFKMDNAEFQAIFDLVEANSKANAPLVAQIKLNLPADETADYLSSLLHMRMNRIFNTRQRNHEMVLYDFLHRTYVSQLKRELGKNN